MRTNDYQKTPVRVVENASNAQLYGAEMDLTVEPIDRLILRVNFAWLEGKFLDFTDSGVRNIRLPLGSNPPSITTDVPIDYTGNRLPNTPEFTLSGTLEYTLELGRYGSIRPRYDFSWTLRGARGTERRRQHLPPPVCDRTEGLLASRRKTRLPHTQ
jgi:iron complex outermembrane receptor protein